MTNKEIIFQILEWSQFHEEKQENSSSDEKNDNQPEYKIRLFGRTNENKSIFVNVENFTPFFYIEIPINWTNTQAYSLVNYLKSKINSSVVKGFKNFDIIEKKNYMVLLIIKILNLLD